MEELEKQDLEMMLKIVIEFGTKYPIVQLPHTHQRFISIIMDTICQNSKSVKSFDFKSNPGFNPKVTPSYVETVKSSEKDNYIFYDRKNYWDKIENYLKDFSKYYRKYQATPKYKLVNKKVNGENKKRIIANKDFLVKNYSGMLDFILIEKGTRGGLIDSEKNLEQYDESWIDIKSTVFGNARVENNSFIINSSINDNAYISSSLLFDSTARQNAQIIRSQCWNSLIHDNSRIENSELDCAHIYDDVEIFNSSFIEQSSIKENVWIDNCTIKECSLQGNQKYKNKKLELIHF